MPQEKRILLIGSNGQLGSDLMKVLENAVPLTHKDIEICDEKQTKSVIEKYSPEIVINTSAFHKVDLCEDEVEKSFQVNAYAVRNLAMICKEKDIILVHISTDYVFDGRKNSPYSESDSPNPLNVYGVSKLAGEYFIRNILERFFIIRSSGLYGAAGASGKGGNFVELMIRFAKEGEPIKVVDDQVLTPTYTRELAENIAGLIKTEEYGIFHVTNNGECSWFEFAREIFELGNFHPELSPTTTEDFGAKAMRPSYSVLGNDRLKRTGLDRMSPWKDALKRYMQEKGYIKNS